MEINMNSNIKKMIDIKIKTDRFDFIALGALRYSELHDSSELKDYIIECMNFLNVSAKDVKKLSTSIYNIYFMPLIKMTNINIGSSGGKIVQSLNAIQFSHDVYLGIKKLNDKHFNNYQTKVSLFDQFQIDSLTRLQKFFQPKNRLNQIQINSIIDHYNNNNPIYNKSTQIQSIQTKQTSSQQNPSIQTKQISLQQNPSIQTKQTSSQQNPSIQTIQSITSQEKQQQSQNSNNGLGITNFLMSKIKSWTVGDKNKPNKPKNK
jgi:hypothetical protein